MVAVSHSPGLSTGRRLPFFLSLLALSMPATSLAEFPQQAKAQKLFAAEKFVEAYTLLDKASIKQAGDPEFDYLLGIAAMRAGKPAQAVFALERVVQTQPEHAAARMELVSAYMQLDMNEQAQEQLAILETMNPPPAARESMTHFQDVLDQRLSGTPQAVRLLGLSVGYDSNVGSYPDMGLDLGGLLLTVQPTESAFSLLRGTWWQPYKLSDTRQLETSFHAQIRNYQDKDATQFNLGLLHAGVTLKSKIDPVNSYDLGLQANKLWLDNQGFRDHLGVSAWWDRRLDAGMQGRLGLKLQSYRFDPKLYDYDMTGLSGELHKEWSKTMRGSLTLELGQEKALETRFGGDATQIAVGGRIDFAFAGNNMGAARLTFTQTAYADAYAAGTLYNPTASDEKRTDNAVNLNLQWRRSLGGKWQIEADADYRKQNSSVRFYETDRWTAQLTVLRYF